MRILLKFDRDCSADAAWGMLTDPRALQQLYSPVMSVTPLEPGGFPAKLGEGRHEIAVRAFGLLPMGTQFITITFPKRKGGVRMLRDSGPTTSGLLGLITTWEHSMAVSSLPDGRTRYRSGRSSGVSGSGARRASSGSRRRAEAHVPQELDVRRARRPRRALP